MKKTQIVLAGLLISMTVCVSGCLVIAVGAGAAGTVAYVKGELETTLDAGLDRSYDATLKGLEQLHITAIQKSRDELAADLLARTATDDKVTIKLAHIDDKLTRISIRIGVFGDQKESVAILEGIKKNLK